MSRPPSVEVSSGLPPEGATGNEVHPNSIPDGASLYLHVPFCTAICDFCAFDKALPSPGDWDRYREGIEREWSAISFEGKVSSVFWGGGTPGLLKAADISRIGERFQEQMVSEGEWTVELTPLCPTSEKLAAWKNVGVNRLSLGVQSFSDRLLQAMGRPYETTKVGSIVDKIRRAGFSNLNLDLIIAYPGQTRTELLNDLQTAVSLQPDHISVYCLTLEEDTALYTRLTQSGHRPDPEEEAILYETAWEFLEAQGYHQYEISNFSRPGFHCAHHLNVWRMGNWRGLGPSAASQIKHLRFRNPFELQKWYEFVPNTEASAFPDLIETVEEERILERIVFGLRMNEGVSHSLCQSPSGLVRERLSLFFDQLIAEDYLVCEDGRFRLTLSGRLVVDEISRRILG